MGRTRKRSCEEIQSLLRGVYQALARCEPVVSADIIELLKHARSGKAGCRKCHSYLIQLCIWEEAYKKGNSNEPPEPTV